ncbi:MAG: outer membrane beta-barrel protein [Gelidibacter sp.]|nr:porin family protein [Gelidibacter sp.]
MKHLFVTLLFVSITTFSFSQDTKYGVRFGTNISNMNYTDDPINANPHRNGFVFGVFVDYGITEKLSVMPEFQYSAEGSNLEYFKTDYLNLPVILNYTIFNNFSIGVGPQVGLKVHKKNDGFKNFVFSGVGFAQYMISDEFGIDFRYIYGLSNVFDNNLNVEAKAGVMQFGVSYRL